MSTTEAFAIYFAMALFTGTVCKHSWATEYDDDEFTPIVVCAIFWPVVFPIWCGWFLHKGAARLAHRYSEIGKLEHELAILKKRREVDRLRAKVAAEQERYFEELLSPEKTP